MPMPSWIEEVEKELRSAREALKQGNEGRARTAARRAAGIALQKLSEAQGESTSGDFISLLRAFSRAPGLPAPVADAAGRLAARIGNDFTSPSLDPIADATAIIEYVRTHSGRE